MNTTPENFLNNFSTTSKLSTPVQTYSKFNLKKPKIHSGNNQTNNHHTMDQDNTSDARTKEEGENPNSSPINGASATVDNHKGHDEQGQELKEIEDPIPDTPSTPEEEKNLIKEMEAKNPMKPGDTWYVISSQWWRKWKDYVSYDYSSYSSFRQKPGPIDNADIIEYDPECKPGEEKIKKSLMEHYDFVVVHSKIWKTFLSW